MTWPVRERPDNRVADSICKFYLIASLMPLRGNVPGAWQGGGYRYRGDPFGAACMYSQEDYGPPFSGIHPPLIGFSLDGFLIHGRCAMRDVGKRNYSRHSETSARGVQLQE